MQKFFDAPKTMAIIAVIIIAVSFFDASLACGILFLSLLLSATFLAIRKKISADKYLFAILVITVIIHLLAVFFIYYAHFQPFGGGEGDYAEYDSNARYLSERFEGGDFSDLSNNYISKFNNHYTTVVAIIYTLVSPQMIVGQFFNVWLAMVSVLFIYLLVQEMGGSSRQAFVAGLIANFYPSFLFYGSLLLKDPLVLVLALASILIALKLIKNFSWRYFLVFYIALLLLTHFRFYVSYSAVVAFMIGWLFFSNFKFKKRILYAIVFIFLIGFLPQISGYGYMGYKTFRSYINFNEIVNFREQVYVSSHPVVSSVGSEDPASTGGVLSSNQGHTSGSTGGHTPYSVAGKILNILRFNSIEEFAPKGQGSSFEAKADFKNPFSFLINYAETSIYTLFGPFPWQIRLKRQLFALIEVLPWYILFIFIVRGIIKTGRNYKTTLPLLIFSFLVLAILALFTPNYGIITRIRIPAFLALICFVPFGVGPYIDKSFDYIKIKLNLKWLNT